jgi:hypothetical protein
MKNNRYVRPASQGGWEIVKEGHRRGTALETTKARAIVRARELVRSEGGGEVRVMNRTGKLVDSNTVPARRPRASRAR